MKFAGFIKNSLIDYPGQVSSVVFTSHCNLNCNYCHNHDMLNKDGTIDEDIVIDFLKDNKIITAIVISGGEPLLHQSKLRLFLIKIKSMFPKLKIKLDTNGLMPGGLCGIIDLVNYVAMDIKGDRHSYELFGTKNYDNIKDSIHIIESSGVDYEFRMTVNNYTTIEEIKEFDNFCLDKNCYITLATKTSRYTPIKSKLDIETKNLKIRE